MDVNPAILPLVLRTYVEKQAALCQHLAAKFKLDSDLGILSVPKAGSVQLEGECWDFARHGTGIRFSQTGSNEIIDAHVRPISLPAGADSWRLLLHLESLGVELIPIGSETFPAKTQSDIDRILLTLTQRGCLNLADEKRGIYLQANQNSGCGSTGRGT